MKLDIAQDFHWLFVTCQKVTLIKKVYGFNFSLKNQWYAAMQVLQQLYHSVVWYHESHDLRWDICMPYMFCYLLLEQLHTQASLHPHAYQDWHNAKATAPVVNINYFFTDVFAFRFLIFHDIKFMAVIIDYEDQYHKDFQRLNMEWLEKFNLVESHDLEVLDHPQENVIDRGGFLFLLKEDNAIIGSAGVFKINDKEYELIKMSVAPEHRGKKFGDMLLEKCITKAKEMNASKIILYSNSNLQTAIRLYEKFGFKHVDAIDAPFETADIKMELAL